ncbi:hypothetical protein P7C70_g2625, partial [Phenoliferia sp. Uapishka_3]
MSRISSFVALSTLALRAVAQIPATASATDLALVEAQYVNSGLASTSNTGFGVPLKATALLTIEYGFGTISNGAAYTVDQVFVTPTNSTASSFTSSSLYTLTLADAASLGDPDVEGNYRHFLVNGLTGAAASGANETFEPTGGNVITAYAAPGPIAGTGPHRYAWLLFSQPSSFAAPANLSSTTAASHWNVSSYVSSSGLGDLIAASFFTVENGTPTGSVASTQAVNTATLASAASSAASAGSSAAKSASSGASSSAAATGSQAANSGAGKTQVAGSLALGAGVVALFL